MLSLHRWTEKMTAFKAIIVRIVIVFSLLFSLQSFAMDKSSYPSYEAAKKKSDNHPIKPSPNTPELWSNIIKTFAMPHYANTPEVQAQIRWYTNHRDTFYNIVNNASPYLYFVYHQVKKNNLPGELVLLPVIESAYDPFAYSHAGAAGLWQMMPATGSDFGLKQDYWYDGRRDITSSTHAALTYLAYLDNFFDDNWLLAIAAYNSGQGTVSYAYKYNERLHRSTEFWSLGLPDETESYVPRLLAVAEIIAHPSKYGFTLPRIPDRPYFAEVKIDQQMDLSKVAELSGMDINDIYALNPGYSHWKTDPKGPSKVLLPIDRASLFKANLNHSDNPVTADASTDKKTKDTKSKYAHYKVKKGDTLTHIAKLHSIPEKELEKINKLYTANIRVGQTLLVPTDKNKETT